MTPKEKVEQLVSTNRHLVNFGSADDAVGEAWVQKAELALGRPLPESYKWFLKMYGGGEISSEEIYSIYGLPFDSVNGGDIVFQHLANRKAGLLDDSKLVISTTDLGEVFFFEFSELEANECPIYLRLPSGQVERYAGDFYDFLIKRIEAYLS